MAALTAVEACTAISTVVDLSYFYFFVTEHCDVTQLVIENANPTAYSIILQQLQLSIVSLLE